MLPFEILALFLSIFLPLATDHHTISFLVHTLGGKTTQEVDDIQEMVITELWNNYTQTLTTISNLSNASAAAADTLPRPDPAHWACDIQAWTWHGALLGASFYLLYLFMHWLMLVHIDEADVSSLEGWCAEFASPLEQLYHDLDVYDAKLKHELYHQQPLSPAHQTLMDSYLLLDKTFKREIDRSIDRRTALVDKHERALEKKHEAHKAQCARLEKRIAGARDARDKQAQEAKEARERHSREQKAAQEKFEAQYRGMKEKHEKEKKQAQDAYKEAMKFAREEMAKEMKQAKEKHAQEIKDLEAKQKKELEENDLTEFLEDAYLDASNLRDEVNALKEELAAATSTSPPQTNSDDAAALDNAPPTAPDAPAENGDSALGGSGGSPIDGGPSTGQGDTILSPDDDSSTSPATPINAPTEPSAMRKKKKAAGTKGRREPAATFNPFAGNGAPSAPFVFSSTSRPMPRPAGNPFANFNFPSAGPGPSTPIDFGVPAAPSNGAQFKFPTANANPGGGDEAAKE